MAQYCRYCCYCMTANGNWCEAKEKPLTDTQIKHTNKCKLFEFTPMDAWDCGKEYKPRPPKQKNPFAGFQESLFAMLTGNKNT